MKRALLFSLLAACATTGASGQGDLNLPSEGVGPFRKITGDEVVGVAPFVFDDSKALYREPAVLAEGEGTLLYVVATIDGADVIVRTRADDGRTFFGATTDIGHDPAVVLRADQPWEGGALSGPWALRTDAGITLYYAAAGGIGVATSTDGLTFTKVAGPILARASSWETTQVHAPSAYLLGDGGVRLLYASGGAIGEAESADGRHFMRLPGPILEAAAPAAPGSLLPNEKPPFDTAGVDDPCVSLVATPAGRTQLRVLYTGTDASGVTTIGLSGRYTDAGPLDRQPTPVYAINSGERAPALLQRGASSFLYVQQNRKIDATRSYPAIAAAYAPGTAHLPLPSSFPEGP